MGYNCWDNYGVENSWYTVKCSGNLFYVLQTFGSVMYMYYNTEGTYATQLTCIWLA